MAEVSGYNKGINNLPLNQQPVRRSSDIAQTGGVKSSQKVQKAATQGTEQTAQKVQEQKPIETFSRKMTTRDVVNQLLQLGVRATAENRSLAMKMLVLGLELSKENFAKIDTLLQGLSRNSFTEQAAVIAVTKGLDSKEAVQQLTRFLENNPQLSQQLNNVQNSINALQSILSGQNILSPVLTSQLAAVLVSLEGAIIALPDNIKKEMRKGRGLMSKSELLTNMRAVKSLVNGVSDQIGEKANANNLIAALGKLAGNAKDVAENIIVQAILSRVGEREDSAMSDKFSYWQIPNSMATPPETIELLVQRDKKNKNKTINKRKTKMIIKMTTKELGEMAVEVDVADNDLDLKFNTKDDNVRDLINKEINNLKSKLAAYNYKTQSVRIVKRNLDVKKFLIPTLDLNNLTRVQTEV